MQLYRAMIHKRQGRKKYRVGKKFPVEMLGGIRETVSQDTGEDVDSSLIIIGPLAVPILDPKYKPLAYVMPNDYRLRGVVYFTEK